jgi:N-acetylglucosamine kinase-like BadF-type ATPase
VGRRTTLLAVDGGNSKTDLALVTSGGELLALERGPTISHQQVPIDVAVERLVDLAGRAAATGGVSLPVPSASFVLAGADFASDVALLRRAFGGAGIARRLTVRNDAFGARPHGARRRRRCGR